MSACTHLLPVHQTSQLQVTACSWGPQPTLPAFVFPLPCRVQLRLLQEAIKREEDYLAEERRREIQARAEADEEAKCAYYLAKQEEREMRLAERQQQADLLRMLRAEEAQARFEYIRSRAAEVSEKDRERREELARKLEVRVEKAGCSSMGGALYKATVQCSTTRMPGIQVSKQLAACFQQLLGGYATEGTGCVCVC